jgi:hypothetical protein
LRGLLFGNFAKTGNKSLFGIGYQICKSSDITTIADFLQTDYDGLLKLWLADQVTAVVTDERNIANKVLNIAKQNIHEKIIIWN